jgi:prefoldin subunit 5
VRGNEEGMDSLQSQLQTAHSELSSLRKAHAELQSRHAEVTLSLSPAKKATLDAVIFESSKCMMRINELAAEKEADRNAI